MLNPRPISPDLIARIDGLETASGRGGWRGRVGHWPMIQPLKTDWPAIAPDVVRTLLGPPNPDALKPQGAAVGQARQFRPDLGLRPLAGLRKRPLRWRPGPGGAGNRRGPRRGTRMAEIPADSWKSTGKACIRGPYNRFQRAGRTRKHHLPPHSHQQPPPCGGARHFLAAGGVPRSPFPTTSTTRRADG